ncbi:uncharacterized protein EAE97_006344 [Botrytis byssoidea]|uniref:Rhodopsin domain-containing protein n=1 Tax=Botrytis byssoidea TaxID=139641 RepID=A0A9P5IMT1_9HELO|nr:uncharacterized protein EAE97_006344 [Botrytis byssoidea]KAF7942890.1 hypothetical protein EAE97_006344 [Botrytis byssoidea]
MNRTQVFITDTNKTPLIELFVWVPLSISCLGVAARLATKIAIFKKLHLQDHLVSISLLLAIGQSIAVTIQYSNGYGQHLSTLSTSHQEGLLKAGYAANLLFIASLCFVKLSIALFIDNLTPITRERQAARVIGLIILLWTISSIFSSAFQCSVPRPWDRINGSCINQKAFGNYYAAVNIITDFSLILMVVAIATHIQTSRLRRFAIMVIFGIRICVIAATGVQIYYLNKPSKDLAFDPWPEAIITQSVLCLSILTACLPYL